MTGKDLSRACWCVGRTPRNARGRRAGVSSIVGNCRARALQLKLKQRLGLGLIVGIFNRSPRPAANLSQSRRGAETGCGIGKDAGARWCLSRVPRPAAASSSGRSRVRFVGSSAFRFPPSVCSPFAARFRVVFEPGGFAEIRRWLSGAQGHERAATPPEPSPPRFRSILKGCRTVGDGAFGADRAFTIARPRVPVRTDRDPAGIVNAHGTRSGGVAPHSLARAELNHRLL